MAACNFSGSQCVSDKALFSPLTNSSFLAPEATTHRSSGTRYVSPFLLDSHSLPPPPAPLLRVSPFSLKIGLKFARKEKGKEKKRGGGESPGENEGRSLRKFPQREQAAGQRGAPRPVRAPQRSDTNAHLRHPIPLRWQERNSGNVKMFKFFVRILCAQNA